MDTRERKAIYDQIEKAYNQLSVAREHVESHYRCSEAIEAAQECVELSVKAILSLLQIDYELRHQWDREDFEKMAEQIKDRGILDRLSQLHLHQSSCLPRLLLLTNLWGHFYLPAKYGFAQHLASANREIS